MAKGDVVSIRVTGSTGTLYRPASGTEILVTGMSWYLVSGNYEPAWSISNGTVDFVLSRPVSTSMTGFIHSTTYVDKLFISNAWYLKKRSTAAEFINGVITDD